MPLGRHVLLELYDCDPFRINDVGKVERVMLAAARAARTHIVDSVFHTFNPQGVSGVVVIAESHLTIHTWPEFHFASVDIYTCGQGDPWRAIRVLERGFRARNVAVMELKRGLLRKA